MRYQNWDILLFPQQSRVPVQEFDTKCHVLHDPKATSSMSSSAPDDPFLEKFESLSKVPILTCFVPSLTVGAPFRISIHSWLKPTASTLLRSSLSMNETATFEVRVYVDGVHHSRRMLHSDSTWPEVIETTDLAYVKANDELRFPPFHPEILQQAHWDAGEQLGRVKIVISEGVMTQQSYAFDRLRDVVAFSFQHAPLSILEYSGIAWPTPRMFETIKRDPHRPVPIASRVTGINDQDAHAHSPQRSTSSHRRRNISGIGRTGVSDYLVHQQRSRGPSISTLPAQPSSARAFSRDEDPFMGLSSASRQWRSKGRSNSTDATMPDFDAAEAGYSRTPTDMSGVSWPRRDFQRHMDEVAVDEIVQALSPEKKGQLMKALSPVDSLSSGLQPPANTPKTAEGSQQPSPMLTTSKFVAAQPALGLDRLLRQDSPHSDDSSVNRSPPSNRKPSSMRTLPGVGDPKVVTRSENSRGSIRVRKDDSAEPINGERSMSDSSKRRKISLSPTTNTKTTPKVTLRLGLNKASSEKENQQVSDDEQEQTEVSITLDRR